MNINLLWSGVGGYLLANYWTSTPWSDIWHHLAVVRGCWSAFGQRSNIILLWSRVGGQLLPSYHLAVVNYWSAIAEHLVVAKGCWSAICQLSCCCGQGLMINYLAVWPAVTHHLAVVSGWWSIYEPVPLKNPLAALCLGNEKQAAKHANNSKGEKHHTRKHLTHKRTGKGACKQAKQANKAGQTCKAGQPCKAGDRQNTQIVPKHYSLLQKKGRGNILGITFFLGINLFWRFSLGTGEVWGGGGPVTQ